MGMFGLIDALTKVRAGSGESFETFALPHIREAILDELQKIAGSDTPSPNCAELCPRYPRLLTICLRQVDTYSADTNESILSLAIVLFLSEFPSTDLVGDDAVVFSFNDPQAVRTPPSTDANYSRFRLPGSLDWIAGSVLR